MKFEGFRIQQLIILSHRDSEYGKLLPGKYQSTPKKTKSKKITPTNCVPLNSIYFWLQFPNIGPNPPQLKILTTTFNTVIQPMSLYSLAPLH